MKSRYEHHGIVWVDLENPSRHEIIEIAAEFNLDALIAEELLSPSMRPRVDVYPAYTYLILHFPALRHSHKSREQEIDFVIGKKFLITTHYDTVDPLHKFSKVFEVNSVLDMGNIGDHAGYVFFYMLKKLYRSVEHELDYLKRELISIEDRVFSNQQVEMVEAISHTARALLNLRQTIEPHRDVLRSLEADAGGFFGDEFRQYIRGLENEYYRVHNHITRAVESLHELRETNNSLLTTRQNETMRVLTIMALLTFPLSLMVAIFDINTIDNPFYHVQNGFWIIVGLVLTLGLAMLLYFRVKKWL